MNLLNVLYLRVSFLLIMMLFVLLPARAQFLFELSHEVEVIIEQNALPNAWAGGITAAQISRIDVNLDGLEDIFIFDRDGNRKLVFINQDATPGSMNYRYAPEFAAQFPNLRDWVLLRDFDCDGKKDIFTSFQSSITVFRNTSTEETGLSFELVTQQLNAVFDFGNGPNTFPLVCLSIDMPSIVDYDGDGDLDIVTFTESATTLYFFTNNGSDNGECGGLDFVCTNRCYGMIAEGSEDNSVFFGDDFQCPFNVADPRHDEHYSDDGNLRHAGGSLVSIDLDDNGVLDLVVGDSGFSSLQAWLMQNAVDGQDSTYAVDAQFPFNISGEEAVDLYRYPAGYYEDVNNDGAADFMACPNSRFQADDDNGVWLYLNEGTTDSPDLNYIKRNFLQEEMIEVGNGAYPVLFDYDNDGLLDLIVANKEYYLDDDTRSSQFALFKNTGTAAEPQFTLLDLNWLNMPALNLYSLYPAFGDLNNDGKADLIVGNENGELHFFENMAGEGETMVFNIVANPLTNGEGNVIDVGQFSTPQLIDVNGDGLLDLLVGEKLGNINYFENTGTAENMAFTQVLGEAGENFGGILVDTFLGINGYSVPMMVHDSAGALQLYVTGETGAIEHYDGINGNLTGLFNEVSPVVQNIREGYRAGIAIADLTADDKPELIYGIANGGLYYYGGVDSIVISTPEIEREAIQLYPNPSRGTVTLVLPENIAGNEQVTLRIYSIDGRRVDEQSFTPVREQVLHFFHLPVGWYIVEVQSLSQTFRSKLRIEGRE
jgi:hypothetical protein